MNLLLYTLLSLLLLTNKGYEDFLKKGDEFHQKFDNVNAVANYEKAYKIAPDNYDVLLKLVWAYNDAGEEFFQLRNRTESEKYINKALVYAEKFHKLYPDSASTYCYLSMSYGNLAAFRGGNEKIKLARKVEENAKKSLEMNKNQYIAYVILGIYNREVANLGFFERLFANAFFGGVPEGSNEESIRMFNKALEIEPNTIVPVYQLSKTYRNMGNEAKEKELLQKLLTYKIKNFRDKFAIEKAKRRLETL
jgi:tetratricopeptide (TPR) repeat protein